MFLQNFSHAFERTRGISSLPLKGFGFWTNDKIQIRKRLAGILYLCYRTRITMEFNFEFGFTKSNLIRRSFHGGALIEGHMVSPHRAIFQRKQTHN